MRSIYYTIVGVGRRKMQLNDTGSWRSKCRMGKRKETVLRNKSQKSGLGVKKLGTGEQI